MEVIVLHDTVEANGKTIKENNLELKHNIPVGSLVEVQSEQCRFSFNNKPVSK